MNIQINGRIGHILTLVLGIVFGLGLVIGFALPAPLIGAWLALGCLLWLAGV